MKVLEEINEKCCSHCEAECDGCWLKELISDYTKQVRKEVCDRVYNVLTTESVWIAFKKCWLDNGECKELRQLLDQIQGETNET